MFFFVQPCQRLNNAHSTHHCFLLYLSTSIASSALHSQTLPPNKSKCVFFFFLRLFFFFWFVCLFVCCCFFAMILFCYVFKYISRINDCTLKTHSYGSNSCIVLICCVVCMCVLCCFSFFLLIFDATFICLCILCIHRHRPSLGGTGKTVLLLLLLCCEQIVTLYARSNIS